MDTYKENAFIFSSKYRVWRHVVFWLVHTLVVSMIYSGSVLPQTSGLIEYYLTSALFVLPYIIYSYPIMYFFIPRYLLKEKYTQFALVLCVWAVFGWFLNYIFRLGILMPFRDYFNLSSGSNALANRNPWAPGSYFVMNTMAGFCCMIVLFKYWVKKQHDWMQAEKEKVSVELQLLKAQVHPHFLFNTLNNIYAFSLENSPKTPQLVLKLSSLLSYMLYDCRADVVPMEKEISVMKDYIDLEKERYGNKLEVSLNIEGNMHDKYIAPLILLPFLENAFKHGLSEQLEKPWLSMDLSVKHDILRCKIVNSKNAEVYKNENGIGISNVKKRLIFLYPEKHELKIDDEADFFVVSLLLHLKMVNSASTKENKHINQIPNHHETSLPVS